MTTSFAYVHCKPNEIPFYVGKGSLRRAKYLGERNNHHKSIVSKYGRSNILIGMLECSNESIAFELEKGLIKCLRRMNVKLANYTDGGEGGSNPCAETRKRLSDAAKLRGISDTCRLASIAARKGKPLSNAQKVKQSNTLKGVIFSEKHKENISISAKKRGMPVKTILAAKLANTGRGHSDEEREARRQAMLKVWDNKGRKPKPNKQPKKSSWGDKKPTRAVYVDGILYSSLKEAAASIGVTSSHIIYALKNSGVTKGHTVWEPNK
jgi:hypothetical protein